MSPEQRIAQLEADLARERAEKADLWSVLKSLMAREAANLPRGVRLPPGGPVPTEEIPDLAEPVLLPQVRIRMKTPEERSEAEARHRADVEKRAQAIHAREAERQAARAKKLAAARVYFVQHEGGERLIKIGTTTRDVSVRLRELQAGHGSPLVIRASAPGGHREEHALHHRFSALWVAGEWFRPGEELTAYVSLVASRGVL